MAEWSKAAGCKPVSNTRVGSNPTFLNKMKPLTMEVINLVVSKKNFVKNLKTPLKHVKSTYFKLHRRPTHLLKSARRPHRIVRSSMFIMKKRILGLKPSKVKAAKLTTHLTSALTQFMVYRCVLPKPSNSNILRIKRSKSNIIKNSINKSEHIFALSFQRNRFFPYMSSYANWTYMTTSLGIFAKFLNKRKSFLKTKAVYLIVANFLRKILLFSKVPSFHFLTKKVPKYYQEILSTLFNPVPNLYNNPFNGTTVFEDNVGQPFYFTYVLYFNNKSYTTMKTKQQGRLKRKIQKRLNSINRVLD